MARNDIPELSLIPPDPEPVEVCIDCGEEIQGLGLIFRDGPVCCDCIGRHIMDSYNVYDLSYLFHVPILDPTKGGTCG